MGTERIKVVDVIPTSAEAIYDAWLDATKHSEMTGGRATSDGHGVGARFTAWDDYIWGEHIELEPNKRIVQSWTTSQFPPGAPPSRVEVQLEEVGDQTRVVIVHSDIPEGQGAGYEGGWQTFYFTPMKRHFATMAVGEEQVLSQRSGKLIHTLAVMPDPKPAAKAKAKPIAKAKAIAKPVAKKAPKPVAKAKAIAKKAPKPAKKKIVAKAKPKAVAKKKAAKKAAKKKPATKKAVTKKAAKKKAPKKATKKAVKKKAAKKKSKKR